MKIDIIIDPQKYKGLLDGVICEKKLDTLLESYNL